MPSCRALRHQPDCCPCPPQCIPVKRSRQLEVPQIFCDAVHGDMRPVPGCFHNMRPRLPQPCSLCRPVDLRVHATARRMHIRRRVAVLRNSARPASVRPAAAAVVAAFCTLAEFGGTAFAFLRARRLAPAPRAAAPAALPRHLRRGASSPEYRLLAPLASGGQCREPLWRVSLNEPPSPSKPPHPSMRQVCIPQPLHLPLHEKTQGQRLRATVQPMLTEERGAGLSVELSDTRRRGSAIS